MFKASHDSEEQAVNKYIREGGRSFHEKRDRNINPYKSGSSQFNDFERGWSQALKRSPDHLFREYEARGRTPRPQSVVVPDLFPFGKKKEMPEDTYSELANRARERLLGDPSYQPPRFAWRSMVYYIRVEAYDGPLWKIGVTCNDIKSRYCVADRRLIVKIKSWQYETREEAEAIEQEILAGFVDCLYVGSPVLRSGGNSELFTRDVLRLDSQEDFRALSGRSNTQQIEHHEKTVVFSSPR